MMTTKGETASKVMEKTWSLSIAAEARTITRAELFSAGTAKKATYPIQLFTLTSNKSMMADSQKEQSLPQCTPDAEEAALEKWESTSSLVRCTTWQNKCRIMGITSSITLQKLRTWHLSLLRKRTKCCKVSHSLSLVLMKLLILQRLLGSLNRHARRMNYIKYWFKWTMLSRNHWRRLRSTRGR